MEIYPFHWQAEDGWDISKFVSCIYISMHIPGNINVLWKYQREESSLPRCMYVDNLIGPDTVNTVPPKTLEEFIDHGTVKLTLESDLEEARSQLESLPELGIHLYDVTQELLDEGVQKFAESYDALIKTISEKKVTLVIP